MRALRWLNPMRSRWSKRLVFVLIAAALVSTAVVRWGRPIVAGMIARSARQSEAPEREYEMLVTMGEAGLAGLVRNAVDPDPRVARLARKAIHIRIDAWRAATDLSNQSDLFHKVNLLVRLLNQSTPTMTESGVAWTQGLSHQLLDLIPKLKPQHRTRFISEIDNLLAEAAKQPARKDLVVIDEPLPNLETEEIPETQQALLAIRDEEKSQPEPVVEQLPAPPVTAEEKNSLAVISERASQEAMQDESSWRPDWQGSNVPEPDSPQHNTEFTPTRPQSVSESLSAMTDRELLAELLVNAEALQAEQRPRARGPSGRREPATLDPRLEALRLTLAERGYSGVTVSHLEMLLSEDQNNRLVLVDRLMTERSGDSARLLFLLASDSDANVRLAAVSALGASNQRNLVEAAWSIALREEDPRFAAVAERLQSRLR